MKSKKYIKTNKTELSIRLKNDFGLDLETYKNPEMVERLGELIAFPTFLIKSISIPIVIAILIFVTSFFILDFGWIGLTFYIIIGLVLYIISGVITGILNFISKLQNDIRKIINLTFDIFKKALGDIDNAKEKIAKDKNALKDIFKGVTVIVVIPTLLEVVSKLVPLIGGVVNSILQKMLLAVANRISFKGNSESNELTENSVIGPKFDEKISNAQGSVDAVMKSAFSIVQLPFKILLSIALFTLFVFSYFVTM